MSDLIASNREILTMTTCGSGTIVYFKWTMKNTRFISMATELVGHDGYSIICNAIFFHRLSTQMELATRPSQHSAHNLSHRIIWLVCRSICPVITDCSPSTIVKYFEPSTSC